MTQLLAGRIDGLRVAMDGLVLQPGDTGYDEARRVWNAAIDRRPAVIAQCITSADVAAAVRFAVENDLEIAVRCGAHSMWGASVVDDGLMIDLSRMNHVSVDPVARRARVGGGALLADVDAATQQHGLAVPAGTVSHTGVGGLTLGGGMGWLTRKHGLSIDNLLSAQVVTADGRIVRAAMDENDDLYWAVRGGGGNFGVITEFEFRLHPVGPMVQLGMVFWPIEQGRELLRLADDTLDTLDPELNIGIAGMHAPPMPFVPPEHHGRLGIALFVVGFGGADEHAALLTRLREALPPLWEFASPMPFTALQQLLDEPNAWGGYYYDKGVYLERLSDAAIDSVVEQLPGMHEPGSVMLFLRLDGAYSAVGEDDTAFSGGRSPRFFSFVVAKADTMEALAPEREWAREMVAELQPHAAPNVYVNAVGLQDDVRASYGAGKYDRLAHIKAKYDPSNVFRRNANILPAAHVVPQRQAES